MRTDFKSVAATDYATVANLVGCTGIEPVMHEAADLQSTESPLILPTLNMLKYTSIFAPCQVEWLLSFGSEFARRRLIYFKIWPVTKP